MWPQLMTFWSKRHRPDIKVRCLECTKINDLRFDLFWVTTWKDIDTDTVYCCRLIPLPGSRTVVINCRQKCEITPCTKKNYISCWIINYHSHSAEITPYTNSGSKNQSHSRVPQNHQVYQFGDTSIVFYTLIMQKYIHIRYPLMPVLVTQILKTRV